MELSRQGIDTVEISRIEKLLNDLDDAGLGRFFSEWELVRFLILTLAKIDH